MTRIVNMGLEIYQRMQWVKFIMMLTMTVYRKRSDVLDIDNRPQEAQNLQDSYDFVIVGGGTAGSVLANRLSAMNFMVLLLEAGGEDTFDSDIPSISSSMLLSSVDWQFKTENTGRYCLAMKNGQCNWPRGKVIGGSSVIGSMIYSRGNSKDYDRWAAYGNPGWSYEEILKYFKRAEDMRIYEYMFSPYHGTDGYLTVEEFWYNSRITSAFLMAGREMGYEVRDVNGERQTGFTKPPGTLRDGLRCSTAKAYLRPASSRSNLHISFNSHVEKVIINGTNLQAEGVLFTKDGRRHKKVGTSF